ncbi:hypothetical protein CDAR_247541 [Caerostris darwini]|uniref:SOCS box domain-containing protein n=1 Tax=Caerostris darwini TaxID=1538125 RepID=A0AAV4RAE2_9ARAC|nr:hypothetical protein CDAR_247541 [Caerostris darwini]
MDILVSMNIPVCVFRLIQAIVGQDRIRERRHMLCLQVLHFCIVTKVSHNSINTQEAQETLRMIWKSIPDAFLCLEELDVVFTFLKRFLQVLFPERNIESIFHLSIEQVSKFYLETVYKMESHLEPRSLQHLCRVQIRERLSHNSQLPKGLKQLMVPSKIESYLQLEF